MQKTPVYVIAVLEDLTYYSDQDIQKVHRYCVTNNIAFESREFDSIKYSIDKHFVERLPAFHIFSESAYVRTFYPVGRPIQIIQETVNNYHHKQAVRAQRRSFRQLFVELFVHLFVKRQKERKRSYSHDWK